MCAYQQVPYAEAKKENHGMFALVAPTKRESGSQLEFDLIEQRVRQRLNCGLSEHRPLY